MVINGIWNKKKCTFSLKANCLTISLDRSGFTNVYSFDGTGRLWTAMVAGVSYRRGLDGKIVAKWTTLNQRYRRWLSSTEVEQLLSNIHELISNLLTAIHTSDGCSFDQDLPMEVFRLLNNAFLYDPEFEQKEIKEYNKIYKPVGILPPDQYMAVVLQMTEGCSYNSCTFCSFYRDRPFRIKTITEFSEHIQAVRSFLGDGFSLRRTIFLGDANALVVPMQQLIPLVEVVHNYLQVDKLGGIYSFLDGFNADRKTANDYQRLARLGLRRIYIGLESGSELLLKYIKKPGKPLEIVQAVRSIKGGGINVGAIVLLGAGGKKYSSEHVADTIKVLNAMQLDLDDLIYFSELIESEDLDYSKNAIIDNLEPLSEVERSNQAAQIEAGLRFSMVGGTPHISRYDIREFVY